MLNDYFGTLGFVIIGVFILSWIVSIIFYRAKGYDRLESTGIAAN
jgi:nickel/cobalt transporter (NiCoT) family protein